MVAKTKWVLVLLESVITGHRQFFIRDRAAEKTERLLFDPELRARCLFREVKRKRGVSELPKFYADKIKEDSPKNSSLLELLGTDRETSEQIFIVLLTLILGFSFIILFTLFFRSKSTKKTVYLLGVSDSGKSQMLANLASKGRNTPTTVTSQVANVLENFSTKSGKVLRLVDIPGADKVRAAILTNSLSKFNAAGVIYVIDSSQIVKDCREIAECLYTFLADYPKFFSLKKFPILLACNKQDSPNSKSCKVVKSLLEKEFAVLNKTRAAALDETSSSSNVGGRKILTTSENDDGFNFENLPQNVKFLECTTVGNGENSLENVENWLDEI
uniref:Signal recognition particle receptor subunit beta n=1 Tax=Romanomermis culicivorax TaxID=13658 RepID=A0A915I531_ROMCU